ncbi:MAG: PTS sugar transporter subunit IIA [Chlamydiae bacterium CG10_big_fil_rev_8_21_14_0_10_35_9]|nr:MAG: PTS sugar transporter subunit IIA [Chlamydiae bacterium CG10_big_fil_rev_8_21_14_0_10_35_9]
MDLKIKDLAELLNVSETTIRRWLAEGKIPAYRLNHQFRFSRSEIEDWVMSCRMNKNTDKVHPDVSIQSDTMKNIVAKSGTRQFSLYRALHHGEVLSDVLGSEKEQVIRGSVKKIAQSMNLDGDVISELLMDRERLMPTSLNYGIAVPHTRDFLLQETNDVVTVVYPQEPIEYGALDNQPVHTLFFLFACEDKRHLHLLAKLAHFASDEKCRDFLLTKPKKIELLKFIKEFESKIPALAT